MAAQRITAPFVTPERAASVLGVSKSRAKRLMRWAAEAKDNAAKAKRLNEETGDGKTARSKR